MNSKIEYIVNIDCEFDYCKKNKNQSKIDIDNLEMKVEKILQQFPKSSCDEDIKTISYELRIFANSENDLEKLLIDLDANYEIERVGEAHNKVLE
jgi:hypothetical protein